ncbi:MAG: hypothetical protein U0441_37020 [Polyangiaceae bacterium]
MGVIIARAIFVVGAFLYAYVLNAVLRARRAYIGETTRALEAVGLKAKGNSGGPFVLNANDGDVHVEATGPVKRAAPGARPDEARVEVCAVDLPLPLPDCLICRADEVDRMMGPLSPFPRTRTGHIEFDERYRVYFSGDAATSGADAGYRDGAVGNRVSWAQPAILERLLELELRWLRVRDQQCEATFPVLAPTDMVRALRTCENLGRLARGRSLTPVSPGPLAPLRDPSKLLNNVIFPPLMGIFWTMLLSFFVSYALGFSAWDTGFSFVGAILLLNAIIVAPKLPKRTET